MSISTSSIPESLSTLVKQSVGATVESLCGAQATYRVDGHPDAPCDGLCGIISFMGDFAWSFMLALPRQTAIDLTVAFTGFELEFDSIDMSDAVGELANILGGDMNARLEALGAKMAMSLPTVARGHDIQLLLPHDVPCERVSFVSPAGEFWLKVAMARPARGALLMPGQARVLKSDTAASDAGMLQVCRQ
jgi:CheY-specific phosphatase CheX